MKENNENAIISLEIEELEGKIAPTASVVLYQSCCTGSHIK